MLKLVENLYYRLPFSIQNLAISIYGFHWFFRRYGRSFKSELKKCIERSNYDPNEWENYQTEKLRKILLHAFDTVPYYSELFTKLNYDRARLSRFTIVDLGGLPILEKDTFRQFGKSKLLSSKPEPFGLYYPSSGSTGTPTQNLYSKRMHQAYFAIFEARLLYWAGLNYKVPRGVLGGRRIIKDGFDEGPYYRYNFIEKQTYFSAYHISPSTVSNYVEGIKQYKVEYLTGYASANYFLARFIEESGINPPKIRAVLTSADRLTTEMRETFRRVYGCETFDSYNGVEATCLISECEFHRLHIVPDVGIIEILDESGNPCKPGEVGEVITTGLLNFNQPLIRYRMGDLVRLSKEQSCKCGRHMIIVDEIIGRLEDTVIGPDGREMVRFHSIFYNIPSILEGQVIQNSLSDFELNVVTKNILSESDVELLKNRMKSQLGNINVKVNKVETIPRSANGKFKAVISNLKRDQLKSC